ncbi:hypothetical protein RchiOBHm_Chr1g0340281 [Rosa chinensis]|uniref:Uncharacterized protein n=1 Tax=Rosa chinensis TaxID=74649 RepID=A0A2P6SDF4_ROSCH|nr:hypothetical protein RchiOBHm_Chr1g0340281 [Rosa chinensis]
MEAIEESLQLSDSMRKGEAILADEDVDGNFTPSSLTHSLSKSPLCLSLELSKMKSMQPGYI